MKFWNAQTCAAGVARAAAAVAAIALVSVPVVHAGQQGARAAAPARDTFDDFYERGRSATAAIKTLTANFVETTTSSLLTTPLVAKGTIAVERPTRVVVQYEMPDTHAVLIDGNRMTLSWPARRLREVSDIGAAQGRVQKYFLNSSAAELRKQFDIDDRDATARAGTYHVSMVPRRKQIRETLARLELWIDRSSHLMTEMRMHFANGDTKTMTFDHIVPNAVLDAGTFATAP